MLLMDGDISNRSLSFASAYGELTYINNQNTGGARTINPMLNEGKWQAQLDADLKQYYEEGPHFRVCVVSQRSTKVLALASDLKERYPIHDHQEAHRVGQWGDAATGARGHQRDA